MARLATADGELASAMPARVVELTSRCEFAEAATALEDIARAAPNDAGSRAALLGALRLRLGLGDDLGATAAWKMIIASASARGTPETAEAALLIARFYRDSGELEPARVAITTALAMPSARLPLPLLLTLHGTLGSILLELRDTRAAEREYREVLALERSAITAQQSADSQTNDAKDTLGEVRFYFAEQEWAKARRIVLPPHRGPKTYRGTLAYYDTTVSIWLARRMAATLRAEQAYLIGTTITWLPFERAGELDGDRYTDVIDEALARSLRQASAPAPVNSSSPRWMVLSAARVGQMWAEVAAELHRVPQPPGYISEVPPELEPVRDILPCVRHPCHDRPMENAELAIKGRARSAFMHCLQQSAELRVAPESLVLCERWLGRHYYLPVSPITEVVPQATWLPGPFRPASTLPWQLHDTDRREHEAAGDK